MDAVPDLAQVPPQAPMYIAASLFYSVILHTLEIRRRQVDTAHTNIVRGYSWMTEIKLSVLYYGTETDFF